MTTTVARLACDQPTARRLAAYLSESLNADDTICAAFEGDDGQWQVAVHFRAGPDEASLRALVAAAVNDAAAAALTIEPVAASDWVAQSLAGLKPVRAGRFVVHGGHDRARVAANAIGIEIEAALAFGTGHHGTTRGCLLALDQLTKYLGKRQPLDPQPARFARHPPPCRGRGKKKVLDIGTGSGVLAIAAAKIFRGHVIASDIDPVAVASAQVNARNNRVGPAIAVARAAGVNARAIAVHAPYDLIFANILLGPLLRLAVPLRRLSGANARIVLSGLLPGHANAVLAIYRAQGLALERRIALDGWVTLVLHAHSSFRGAAKRRTRNP